MSKTECPLGEDCDLTLAYMMGAEKAKDTIKYLRAEVERLERAARFNDISVLPEKDAEYAALRAENKKLRAALEGYVCTCTGGECAEQAGYRDECGKPARAALEEKP